MATIEIQASDFENLAICALRYCMGRQTYMPSLVRSAIRPRLQSLDNSAISTMIRDCLNQQATGSWGDEEIDKPKWEAWRLELETELKRRKGNGCS